ncbi:MAG: dodecin [Aureliella sp.]
MMSNHVYKKLEIVGTSTNSIEEAVANAISQASQTVRGLRWFEVTETRGDIADGKVSHWQVTVKIGFALET